MPGTSVATRGRVSAFDRCTAALAVTYNHRDDFMEIRRRADRAGVELSPYMRAVLRMMDEEQLRITNYELRAPRAAQLTIK